MSERYPLIWPIGWERTLPHLRSRANFGYGGGRQPLTVVKALERLRYEFFVWTKVGQDLRVDPDAAIISSNLERMDGSRSSQREPQDPGVAVYFELDKNSVVLACDKWDKVADNITAIAAHLAALRGQEQWGVGTMQQAFQGYQALPLAAKPESEESWWEVLGVEQSTPLDEIETVYRRKATVAHPDQGGDHEVMVQLNWAICEARRTLLNAD